MQKKNDGTTSLMIAAKRNNYETFLLLLENGANHELKNDINLTAFDYSVLYCNYKISFYFKEKLNCIPKEIDFYLEQANKIHTPLFNIQLYLESLNNNLPMDTAPVFKLSPQQNRGKIFYLFLDFANKLPDPNETWHDFFQRIMKFEIYQPPMVEKESIPLEKRSTPYMRLQTKLLEIEYNKTSKINFYFV